MQDTKTAAFRNTEGRCFFRNRPLRAGDIAGGKGAGFSLVIASVEEEAGCNAVIVKTERRPDILPVFGKLTVIPHAADILVPVDSPVDLDIAFEVDDIGGGGVFAVEEDHQAVDDPLLPARPPQGRQVGAFAKDARRQAGIVLRVIRGRKGLENLRLAAETAEPLQIGVKVRRERFPREELPADRASDLLELFVGKGGFEPLDLLETGVNDQPPLFYRRGNPDPVKIFV